MVQRSATELGSAAHVEAAQRLVMSMLRGGTHEPGLRDLDLLLSLSVAHIRDLPHPVRKLVLAGMLMARVRQDDTSNALELAARIEEAGFCRLLTPQPAHGFHALEAALAETYLAAGYPTTAVKHAERLLASVRETDAENWLLRSYALCAAAYAVDGEHRIAQGYLTDIAVLRERLGWPTESPCFMEATAELVIAFTALDRERVLELDARVAGLAELDPLATSLVGLIHAIALFLNGDISWSLAASASVAHGAVQPAGPSLVRMCALAVEAMALIQRGTPAQAIALLRDVAPPPCHFVCFDTVRASAFIAMGDYRAALRVTEGCARDRATHNRWMLPGALLRRAIANMRVGNTIEAVTDGLDALTFGENAVPQLGLVMLPQRYLTELGVRMLVAQPGALPQLAALRNDIRRLPSVVSPAVQMPTLSRRERIVAVCMRGERNYGEIAEVLHVSPSTVKSQANAIAKKLGVRTREEAVSLLEASGFYLVYGEDAIQASA